MDENPVHFEAADAASVPLQPHQWVLLDRVICCYWDAGALLANALSAAEVRVGFSVPESRGWPGVLNVLGWAAENVWKTVARRDACRGYVHDIAAIELYLGEAGFRRSREARRGLWHAAIYERSAFDQAGTGQPGQGQPGPSSA